MSLEEELAALKRMVKFVEGEELLFTCFGSVDAPGIDDREGILFLTNFRVGVSAAGGVFTSDDCNWASLNTVTATTSTRGPVSGSVTIAFLSGLVLAVRSHQLAEEDVARRLANEIKFRANRQVRDGLEEIFQLGVEATKRGELNSALMAFDKVLAQQKQCIPALYHSAVVFLKEKDFTEALNRFMAALDAGPLNPWGIKDQMAYCLICLESYDYVLELTTEVIDAGYASSDSFKWRGVAREAKEDSEGALSDYVRATEIDSKDSGAWWLLGHLAREREDANLLAKAVDSLNSLEQAKKARDLTTTLLNLQGKWSEALVVSKQELEKGDVSLGVALAALEAATRSNPAEGVLLLARLDPIFKENLRYQVDASWLLLVAGQPAEAWHRISSVEIPLKPFLRAFVAQIHAAAKLETRDFQGALEVIKPRLVEQKEWIDNDKETHKILARLYYMKGKALAALGDAEAALDALREAEGTKDFEVPWINEDYPKLLEWTSHEVGTVSLRRGGTDLGTSAYVLLGKLSEALEASGRLPEIAARVQAYRSRFDEPPLVAVMGEYSVGKSTFINALLRQPLLPTGEGVTTGTITVVRYGEQERMRALFPDGRVEEKDGLSVVAAFIEEKGAGQMPQRVDVFVKADVLKRIQIVDSPGLNAPFSEHRKLTEAYLTEADAILWLFNVENAGKASEKQFLDKLTHFRRKAVAVVNQIDQVTPDEALDTLNYVKECFPETFAAVLGVSAKRALEGIKDKDESKLKKSGLPALEAWLESHVLAEARAIKEEAAKAKIREAIEVVTTERAAFDNRVNAQATILRDERAALAGWIDRELRESVVRSVSVARQTIEQSMTELATSVAQRSRPDSIASSASVEPLARTFVTRVSIALKACDAELGRVYGDRMNQMQDKLKGIEGPEWRGILSASLRELTFREISWRKDLSDYLEQVSAFLDGFVTGRGVSFAQLDTQEGKKNDPTSVQVAFRPRMAFTWERTESVTKRWLLELKKNADDILARLERELQVEAAQIREDGYRKIERLGAAL
jgi:GTPase Era involved in 16S rRNA processing/predicted Zn-dependent protease